MRALIATVLFAFALASGSSAPAATLDRVRQEGLVRCGGPIGPGVAYPSPDGAWHGLLIDVCRAVAVAALGSDAKIVFRSYLRDADDVAAPSAIDDIAFLASDDLLDGMLPGPAVVYRTVRIMVLDHSPVHDVTQLGDGGVCFEPGSAADRALEAYFAAHRLALHPMPFQETDEMRDAFIGGRCEALAGNMTEIAAFRRQADDRYRILPEILAAIPVLAASRVDDPNWGAVIRCTFETLLHQQVTPPAMGLRAGWQDRVIKQVGDYEAIIRSNLDMTEVGGITLDTASATRRGATGP